MANQQFLVNSSVVLLNRENSPERFSLDFLREHGVVPRNLKVQNNIYTPEVAKVVFGDEYQFFSHGPRTLMRVDYKPTPKIGEASLDDDGLSNMLRSLVDATSKLRYHAVGINFQVVSLGASFDGTVRGIPSEAVPKELHYVVEGDQFRITVKIKHIKRTDKVEAEEPEAGLLVDANFHSDLSAEVGSESRSLEINGLVAKRDLCLSELLGLIDDTDI